jgi:hypothetical protein
LPAIGIHHQKHQLLPEGVMMRQIHWCLNELSYVQISYLY